MSNVQKHPNEMCNWWGVSNYLPRLVTDNFSMKLLQIEWYYCRLRLDSVYSHSMSKYQTPSPYALNAPMVLNICCNFVRIELSRYSLKRQTRATKMQRNKLFVCGTPEVVFCVIELCNMFWAMYVCAFIIPKKSSLLTQKVDL